MSALRTSRRLAVTTLAAAAATAAATLGAAGVGLRTRLGERACTAAMALPLVVVGAGGLLPGPPPWDWTAPDWALLLAAGSAALAWSSRSL